MIFNSYAMETHSRTLMKTLTWRIIATTITIVVIYLWTGDATLSIASGLIANAVKTLFYYIHERLWTKVKYGYKHHKR